MAGKLSPELSARLTTMADHDSLDVVLFLTDDKSKSALDDSEILDAPSSRSDFVTSLKSRVEAGQAGLLEALSGLASVPVVDSELSVAPSARVIERYWINNSIRLEVDKETLLRLLEREDIDHAELVVHTDIDDLLDDKSPASELPVPDFLATNNQTVAWGVRHVNAPLMWQIGHKGDDVTVAVVDTGVNYRHPDLTQRMWQSASFPNHGFDFGNGDNDPIDESGHGTSCAGIIAGDGSLGTSTGVAPKAKVMALRIGNTEMSVWKCLEFAISEGADVISMSISWKYPRNPDYPGWRRVCETILAAGIVHANSIGNQGGDTIGFPIPYNIATPGNCPPPWLNPAQTPHAGKSSAISCGAVDISDNLAYYSGRGPAAWELGSYMDYPYDGGQDAGLVKPDICGPGPGTSSCNWLYDPQNPNTKPYSGFGGTSSATPHVAGCLALLVSACKSGGSPVIPARIQEAVERTAVKVQSQTYDKENHYGAGRVDVFAAFQYGIEKGWWSGPTS